MVEQEPPLPENLAALIGSVDNPTPEALARTLAETTTNIDAYIERRAQEIAAERIAELEKKIADLTKETTDG